MTENTLYSNWQHLVGLTNLKGIVLTKHMLLEWAISNKPELECIFCGTTYDIDTRYCRRCREYKGFQPYIAEWSDSNE